MNISHKHKTIWWAPERCGTKATAHIFKHFDFDFIFNYPTTTVSSSYQSHQIILPPEKYNDYKVVASIRNPYDRVLGVYLKFVNVGASSVYSKYKHDQTVYTFSNFIDELFKTKKIIPKLNLPIDIRKPVIENYFIKYNFDTTIPKNYIRMENIVEDMGKIDFINKSPLWSSGYIKNYLNKNEHITTHPYNFNSVYTFKTAKKVYEYHKQFFLTLGYDPFSFTTEELTNEEKMRFLHEII
jgi:hypothetical protein